MSIREQLVSAATKAGGSFKSIDDRKRHANQLADYLMANNIQIRTPEQLKQKHVIGWIAAAKDDGNKDRSLQNKLTSVRTLLRAAGLDRKADAILTKEFGCDNACRDGVRQALPRLTIMAMIKLVKATDPGVGAGLDLQANLGLRQLEAIRGGRLDTLKRWERELCVPGGRLRVLEGSKTKRERFVLPVNREETLRAVREAIAVAQRHKSGRLIEIRDLKSAVNHYNYVAAKVGFIGVHSPHSLRYAWAQEAFERYLAAGLSDREAAIAVGHDLGHGDGRGRFIKRVYCQAKHRPSETVQPTAEPELEPST